jgi:putative copper resistance protein D
MYQWVVFAHIIAAMVWIGGMLFVALVLVPVLRRESRELRAALLDRVGRRFRTVGWAAIAILLVTGVWNLHNRGFAWETITSADLFRGRFGAILLAKLLFVAAVLTLSSAHDFVLGPASTRAAQQPTTDDAQRTAGRLRMTASWVARINALLALVIIFLAVALVRGLPWQ